jgi:hypothetical protein
MAAASNSASRAHWGRLPIVLGLAIGGLMTLPVHAELAVKQRIVGQNEQILILDHADLLNIARNGGTAEMNLASTVGTGTVQGSKRTVYVRGSIVNVADGRDKTASVNIGTVEAR